MKVVGLITEYNPFHNGHKYHIEEAKRVTGADYVIAVMSGNFVQRGTPAVIDKYSRASMALNNGVDLVLELPVCYATGSAEYFAHGAVALLDKLGIVDYLCFGSECGDIELIRDAAKLLIDAPASFEEDINNNLREGLTYPAARMKAMQRVLTEDKQLSNSSDLSKVLSEPNNILGIEYVKAIYHLNSSIIPITIKRQSAHYHDTELVAKAISSQSDSYSGLSAQSEKVALSELADDTGAVISSATAIRRAIQGNIDSACFTTIRNSVPENVYQILTDSFGNTYPITEDDFSQIIKYKLQAEDKQTLTGYVDITGDLADRLKNITDYAMALSELSQKIKTKNMTLTRINRALIHILLGIRSNALNSYKQNGYVSYARILGMRKEASYLLRKIKATGDIQVITKVSRAGEQLDSLGLQMLSEDTFAAHIYNQAVYEKYGTSIPNEYKHEIQMIS